MPLSQTLLLQIFPKSKAAAAIALWSMTTLVAPILGPIVGGYMCDQISWSWVFFLNVPIALAGGWFAWGLLKRLRVRAGPRSDRQGRSGFTDRLGQARCRS